VNAQAEDISSLLPQQTGNVDQDYLAHRQGLEGRAALSSIMSEGPQQKPKEGAKEEPNEDAAIDPFQHPLGALSAGAKTIGKDVGQGLTEVPRQALLEGPKKAFQAMYDGVHSLNRWISEKTGTGEYVFGKGYESAEEYQHEPGMQLPDFGEPKTVTGGLAQSAGQFITSMGAVGKLVGEGGKLFTAGKSAAAIFAGFEKAQGNLADLVEKVPELSNPITRFLASKPDDTEAEGRLRNAVAGVGFGEVQNGLIKGLGALRAGLAVKEAGIPEVATGQGVQTPRAFEFLGDPQAAPEAPLAELRVPEFGKAQAAEAATEGLTPEGVKAMGEGPPKEPQVYINFARIDTPQDVQRTMQELADAQKGNIDIAKRGIQTFEDTKLGADFTDAWKTLMQRRVGEPLNAEEMLAGRQLLAQSAMKTQGLTDMTLQDPSPENVFAWRKQMQTHAMIQAEVTGAQAEVARSLGAMRIPVGGEQAVDRMAAITQQLDSMGGIRSNLDFLRATKALMDSGKLEELGNVTEKSAYAKTRDGLLTAWINGLLTSPLTHVKVNLSNVATIGLRLAETRLAEGLDQVTDHDGVPAGEAAQTTAGLISGIKDSFKYLGSLAGLNEAPKETSPIQYAGKAFKSGNYSVGQGGGVDWMEQGQGASNALSIADSGWVGKATDLMSSTVTSPGRALAGEHELYRALGMRMELNRFAYRQAMEELGSGKIKEGELSSRVSELVESAPPSISTAAIDGMKYQTFTDAPGKLAETLGQLRDDYPLLRVVLPFYRIPARIMSFTFERSPFAPLMAGWRADIAAGGPRQSLALAKTGLGSSIMLAASDAVLNGSITGQGPKDRTQRQALMDEGWQPYSVKLPSGRWVQYNRLETVGSSMAMAADATETIRDYYSAVNADNPDVDTLTGAMVATLANQVTSKTYLEGLARFFETISDPRGNAKSAMKSFAGSLVPSGVGVAARAMDPYQRATYDMMDAIKARTPGLSKDLPPLVNRWGEDVRVDSGLGRPYDAFAPFPSRSPKSEPIDEEILKEGFHLPAPSAKVDFAHGARVDLSRDPQLYYRYQQLAGNELKLPGGSGMVGLKDRLNDLVTGKDAMSPMYNMLMGGAGGGKELMIRGIAEQYQHAAREQLMEENGPLNAMVQRAQDKRAALRGFVQESPGAPR